jgi:hypothetical protein
VRRLATVMGTPRAPIRVSIRGRTPRSRRVRTAARRGPPSSSNSDESDPPRVAGLGRLSVRVRRREGAARAAA